MPWLLLGGGALLFVAALKSKSTSAQQRAGQLPGASGPNVYEVGIPTAQGDMSAQNAERIARGLAPVLQSIGKQADQYIPGAGAATAAVTAFAVVGGKMTGDAWGALAGGTLTTGGLLANSGRLLGAEVDKMFGGDGRTGTGVVAQIAGFATVLALLTNSVMVLSGIGPLVLIALSVASIVSDIVRLSYGQKGLMVDFQKEGLDYYNKSVEAAKTTLRGMPGITIQDINASTTRIQANALSLTYGYLAQKNTLLEGVWMKKPRGIGQTDDSHRKWGVDRGVFLEPGNLGTVENLLAGNTIGGGVYNSAINDVQKSYARAKGKFLANAVAWQLAVNVPWGMFITNFKQHLDAQLKDGAFQADAILAPDGETKFMGTWLLPKKTQEEGQIRTAEPRPIPLELTTWVTLARAGNTMAMQQLTANGISQIDWR